MAVINGTPGDDRGANELLGTNFDDSIFGFDGRDDLIGLSGDDLLDGGAGDRDSAIYHAAPGAINGSLTSNTVLDGYGGTDTLVGIEEIEGSAHNDTLVGATGGEVILRGRGGDDVITGNNSSSTGGTQMDGGSGDDTLTNIGGEYSFMEPGSGTDSITGSVNSFDIVSYFYSAGYANPPATMGITVTFTGDGVGTVVDYAGNTDSFTSVERIEGTMLADMMTGAAGFQSFRGTGGDDTINGGADVDEVNYDGVRDDFAPETGVTVDLAAGTATDKFGDTDTLIDIEQVRGSRFADDITGDANNNRLRGRDGDDTLIGGAGDDRLEGENGEDSLDGGFGSDQLIGGAGHDILLGGGADQNEFDYLQGDAGDDYLEIIGLGAGVGGDGNDTIVGTSAGNPMVGDFVSVQYFDAPAPIAVNLTATMQFGLAGGDTVNGFFADDGFGTVDTLLNLQRIDGTGGNDLFAVDGTYGQTYGNFVDIRPGAGDDDIAVFGVGSVSLAYDDAGAGLSADLEFGTATDLLMSTNAIGFDTFGPLNYFNATQFGDHILGGSLSNDGIGGNSGDDTINGRGGSDNISGGLGNDSLMGGGAFSNEFDFVAGDGGDDFISITGFGAALGGQGNDTIVGLSLGDPIMGDFVSAQYFDAFSPIAVNLTAASRFGLAGGDTVNGFLVDDGHGTVDTLLNLQRIEGSAGNDLFAIDGTYQQTYGNWIEFLPGAGDDDIAVFGAGEVFLIYENVGAALAADLELGTATDLSAGTNEIGFDTFATPGFFRGSGFGDSILGALGVADVIEGFEGNDTIDGRSGNDVVFGGGGNDSLLGDEGDDELLGEADNDTLLGQLGNDTLIGGLGADSLDGGADFDIASYRGSTARVEINLTTGTFVGGEAQGDTLSNIEAIWASELNDLLIGDGGDNDFSGWGGNDNINGRAGNDVIAGDDGDDLISGGNGDDTLQGGNNNDTLFGNGNDDLILGEAGNDTIFGGAGQDHLEGGNGQDSIIGQGSADTIFGNAGADTLSGGSGNDSIEGGTENDRLFGNGNNDTLDGGDGNDILQGAAGSDVLRGGAGNDILTGNIGSDRLDGGTGNDTMNGGGADGVRDFFTYALGYEQDRINAFDQAGTDRLLLDQTLWSGTNPGLTEQQVVDTFGSLNTTGTILTLDFGNGDILEVQNASGINQATLGTDVAFI